MMNSQIKRQPQTQIQKASGRGLIQRFRRRLGAGMAAIALGVTGAPALAGESIQVGPTFSETVSHSGVATGGAAHNCGEMSQTYTMTLTADHDALRVRVANGPLVLLVTGPGGEFCIKSVNGLAEMEGYWIAGQYQLQVGRRTGTAQNVPFNLTVSAQ